MVQYPLNHRPCHDWKSRHKVNLPPTGTSATEPRDLVVRVLDDVRTHWEHPHVVAVHVVRTLGVEDLTLLGGHIAHARLDQQLGFGMQGEFNLQGSSRTLAGVIVRGGTDAAA
ncbi:hypothetical protein D9M69_667310 [compost metagenome]